MITILQPTKYDKRDKAMKSAYDYSKIAPNDIFYVTRANGQFWISEVPPDDRSLIVCTFTDGVRTTRP